MNARLEMLADTLPHVAFHLRDEGARVLPDPRFERRVVGWPRVFVDESIEGSRVTAALAWHGSDAGTRVQSFVNYRPATHGTHIRGLRQAVREFSQRHALRPGFDVALAVLHRSVEYGSPTRDVVVSRELRPLVKRVVSTALERHFAEQPDEVAFLRERDRLA